MSEEDPGTKHDTLLLRFYIFLHLHLHMQIEKNMIKVPQSLIDFHEECNKNNVIKILNEFMLCH